MKWFLSNKKSLGIDIGTSSIKIIELSRVGKRIKLENYGEISAEALFNKPFRAFEENILNVSSNDIAQAIRATLDEMKIKTKMSCFSIPDFSTFFTWFDLPLMTEEEIPSAIKFEARKHIPVPLSEVTLDWQTIKVKTKKNSLLKILLVATPNEVISQYKEIASLAGLKIFKLEAEIFAFFRALNKRDEKKPQLLVDIGAYSTTASVVDEGVLRVSGSFDVSGNKLTDILTKSGMSCKKAEEIKQIQGLGMKEELAESFLSVLDSMVFEIKKVSEDFYQKESKKLQKIILAGGTARLPGLKEYFFEQLKGANFLSEDAEIEIANPFSNIFYPPLLEGALEKMGPGYSIAIGSCLKGLD
ncbi:MAG: type IV pilus assembly protein PilM [Patescibacteria group bacterium]|nr:type IV pilus assembly protein PilM [Patescibacteria group bacterium]